MSLIASTLSAAAGDRTPTSRVIDLIANASFDNVTDTINSAGTVPSGVHVRSDLPRLYISDENTNRISEWAFTGDPWDASSLQFLSVSAGLVEDTYPMDLTISPDGTKLFTIGNNNDNIYSYTMTTPWDLSTITYDGVAFNTGTGAQGETNPTGLFVKPDGTRLFYVGMILDKVWQHDLQTPWDLSSITSSNTGSNNANNPTPTGLTFSSDGTKMYITSEGSKTVVQTSLDTPWDISTGTLSSTSILGVSAQVALPQGIAFNPENTKMYIVGSSELNQYTTG